MDDEDFEGIEEPADIEIDPEAIVLPEASGVSRIVPHAPLEPPLGYDALGNPVQIMAIPSHGKGVLQVGNYGRRKNKTSAAVRERCSTAFRNRVGTLEKMVDDRKLKPEVRIKAMDLLARTGVGNKVEMVIDNEQALRRATVVLMTFCRVGEEDDAVAAMIAAFQE